MFSSWVTKAIVDNEVDSVRYYPDSLMDQGEYSLVNYLRTFAKDTENLPSLETVRLSFEDADLFLAHEVPESSIEQLEAEAKMSGFNRESKKLMAEHRTKSGADLRENANKIELLWGLVAPPSKPKDYNDLSTFVVPENRYDFPYVGLNRSAGGLLDGEVAMFVGPLKSRKTWITLDMALAAYKAGKRVLFTSLEMRPEEIQRRLQALIGEFDYGVFRSTDKRWYEECMAKFIEKDKELRAKTGGKLIIPERMTRTVSDLRRDVKEYDVHISFVDSIYRFKDHNGRPMTSDWGQLSVMAGMLKDISRDLGSQIVCNSQLKRGANSEAVTTDDIAYSNAFAQEFDLIGHVHSKKEGAFPTTSIQILASRNGPANHATIIEFDFRTTKIEEQLIYRHGSEGEDNG